MFNGFNTNVAFISSSVLHSYVFPYLSSALTFFPKSSFTPSYSPISLLLPPLFFWNTNVFPHLVLRTLRGVFIRSDKYQVVCKPHSCHSLTLHSWGFSHKWALMLAVLISMSSPSLMSYYFPNFLSRNTYSILTFGVQMVLIKLTGCIWKHTIS